jgi:hypothetical protein
LKIKKFFRRGKIKIETKKNIKLLNYIGDQARKKRL